MNITTRNAKEDGSGKHNDRNFCIENATHIDAERVCENLYWTYIGKTTSTFEEVELDFYERHFEDKLEEQNQKHRASKNPSRVKTMREYYHNKRTGPEDRILQIGNAKEHATKEELWDCALEYRDKFEELFGDHCKILDMALHMDETTPHVHIRRVWIAEDENGLQYVSERKALEQLGVPRSDTSRPEGKYNNAKITITGIERQLFWNICIERGLDIDDLPPENDTRQKHLSTKEYKEQQYKKTLSENIELTSAINEFSSKVLERIRAIPKLFENVKEAAAEVKQASDETEKINLLYALLELVIKEYERLYKIIKLKSAYIQSIGKKDEYIKWAKQHKLESKSPTKGDSLER